MKQYFLAVPAAALVLAGCSSPMQNSATPMPTSTPMVEQTESMSSPEALPAEAMMSATKDVVDNAMASPDHTTAVTAIQAAGLVQTLKGKGPFTVFAPTNAAFNKLPAGTVDTLLKPENKTMLTKVLTYHVVPGTYMSTDLKTNMKLKTVQGQEFTLMLQDGKWWIKDAVGGMSEITMADIKSSNGVIHVIDTVIMPK